MNSALSVAIIAVVVLAPLPFGSVRTIYSAVWSSYIGLVAIAYFAALAWGGHSLRVSFRKIWPAALLSIATCTYLAFQMIPIGALPIASGGPATLVSAPISISPNLTMLMLMRQMSYILFVFLVLQVTINDNRRAKMLVVLTAFIVTYAAYGIYSLQAGDTILGMPKWAYLGSATGPFVNRNSFATFLGLGALVPLATACSLLVRQSQRHTHDGIIRNLPSALVLHSLIYLFLLSVVVATQSRMGLIATISGSSVVIVTMLATIGRLRPTILAVPALLALLAVALYLYGGGLIERLGTPDQSGDNRALLYSQVMDLIALRPWTGFGGGTFELAFPLVHRPPVSPDFGWARAHSTYLTLWSELGLLFGTLPMLAILYLGGRMASALVKGRGSWTAQSIGLGAITVGGIHSLVDFSLEIPAVTLLFLLLVAIGVATTTNSDRE